MADREAFLGHFLRHQADLKAFIGALIPNRHVRDDVFQEVALTLWRQFDAYDPSRSFGAWARGVAANKVLQECRRNSRFPLAFSPETIAAVLDAYDRSEGEVPRRAEALRACVDGLPDSSRRLLVLRYENDLPGEEIAREVGLSVAAVYQALSRLRARLEECVRRRLALEDRVG
jgi:RNA polymerase sigma-70 factor (ECF subfamily)